jgi:hypothetical protein
MSREINLVKKLGQRIQKASEMDPLLDLARELYKEGYRDWDLNGLSLQKYCSDHARLKVWGHLRDLTTWRGSP